MYRKKLIIWRRLNRELYRYNLIESKLSTIFHGGGDDGMQESELFINLREDWKEKVEDALKCQIDKGSSRIVTKGDKKLVGHDKRISSRFRLKLIKEDPAGCIICRSI